MGLRIGDVYLALLAEDKGFKADVQKKAGEAGDAAAQTLGQRLRAGLTPERIGTALGAAFGGIAAAGVRMGEKVDDAYDAIRAGTGKTGEALKGLEGDFRGVAARVPDDLGLVGQVVADLNTRTGQTGQGLQDLATTLLDFSRLTKTDVNTNVRNATRLFGDWSIATEDQAATLDKVFRASQETGIGVDALMEKVVSFGSPMRLLGFSFEESIALLGKWEKEGVNTETALAGLKFGVKTLAEDGIKAADMGAELRERLEAIRTSADPVGESIELFGLRAGPDLAAAIVEGRFATEDLLEVITNGTDTIAKATEDTQDWGEAWAKVTNWVQVNMGSLFTAFAGLGNLVYLFPVVGGAFGKMAGRIIGSAGGIKGALETLALKGMYAVDAARAFAARFSTAIASNAVVQRIAAGVASAIDRIPGSGAVKGALARSGGSIGSALGAAFSVGFAAAAILAVVETAKRIEEETAAQQGAIAASITQQVTEANLEGLRQSKAALEQGIRDLQANGALNFFLPSFTQEQITELERQLAEVNASLEAAGAAMPKALSTGILHDNGSVPAAMDEIAGQVDMSASLMLGAAREAGQAVPEQIALGFDERQSLITGAAGRLRDLVEDTLGRRKRIGKAIGFLISDDLADALTDKRGHVRNGAKAIRDETEAELALMIARGGKTGREAMDALERALKSKNPEVRAAAQRVKDIVTGRLEATKVPAGNAGQDAGEAFLARMKSAVASGDFKVLTQVGFSVPGHARGGVAKAGQPAIFGEEGWELAVPEQDMRIFTHEQSVELLSGGAGRGRGDTYNIPINVQGALPVRTARDVVTELRRGAELGLLPARDLSPKYHRREVRA